MSLSTRFPDDLISNENQRHEAILFLPVNDSLIMFVHIEIVSESIIHCRWEMRFSSFNTP